MEVIIFFAICLILIWLFDDNNNDNYHANTV